MRFRSRAFWRAPALLVGVTLGTFPSGCTQYMEPQDDAAFDAERASWRRADGTVDSFRYRLLRPPEADADRLVAATYPLVVFLHGAGERGDDNEAQLRHVVRRFLEPEVRARFPCFVLAVQCRADRFWVNVPWDEVVPTPFEPEPTEDLERVQQALEQTLRAEASIDRDRVYVVGLSMGGFGALDLALRETERIAAVVPICGGGDERLAGRIAHLPMWFWHGAKDAAVPVERSRNMIRALRRAGGDPRYTELAEGGHNAWDPAFDGTATLEWLFAQRRPR